MPLRGGAMARLGSVLERLDSRPLPVHITPVVREMVDQMAAVLPRPRATILRQLMRPALAGRAVDRMGGGGRMLGAMLRNTASPTILETSRKFNVIPSEIGLTLDGRMLPGVEPAGFVAEVREVVGAGVELEVARHDEGPSEPDLGMFSMLAGILGEADPGSTAVPLLMPGVTDGRFFSRLGIQTYGFLPMRLPAGFDFWSGVHGADERIPVDALEFGTRAIHAALERFGAPG